MNQEDVTSETSQIETRFHFFKAEELIPGNEEVKFWKAVGLLNAGRNQKKFKAIKNCIQAK